MNKVSEIINGMQTANRPSSYWSIPGIEFPELKEAKLVIQNNGKTVFDHTMSVIDLLSVKNPITLLSGLFHDLGKIYTIQTIDSSKSKFPGHEISSTHIATRRLFEWGASKYLIDRVCRIIMTHMYDITDTIRDKTIRKFIADVGQDNIENWFIVRKADSASYSEYNQYKRYIIDPFYNAVIAYISKLFHVENNPFMLSTSILQPKSNITVSGKESKDGGVSFLTKGGQKID